VNAKLLTKNSYCLQSTKNSRKCRNCLSEKREIRGVQKLEISISAINVSVATYLMPVGCVSSKSVLLACGKVP
jgi:hypothetical protein